VELPAAARVLAAAAVAVLTLAAAPASAGVPTAPVYDAEGNLIGTPFVPQEREGEPQLTEEQALTQVLRDPKVADWVGRYPDDSLTDEARYDEEQRSWEVKVWSTYADPDDSDQIVLARVDDASGRVTEAWTGPQVAWTMARGTDGAFGREINEPWIWLSFCALFLIGLVNWRRPLSLRTLDLLVLLSFGISLFYFNRGEVFTAMPLAYPPLAYLLARFAWIGFRGRGAPGGAVWPIWALLAATVFLLGFRVGLNVRASNVIDVGLSGIQGAQQIADGDMPYGHMPTDDGKDCGEPDASGYVRENIQTNGRCESANERGDTYGPVAYFAYLPSYYMVGFDGKWNGGSSTWAGLPAAHLTSILWDVLALVGVGLLGVRLGGAKLGATLAFAWASYPFTQYVSSSNSNDAIMPALLAFGLWLVTSAPARGFSVALASWTKFAALLLVPLWASYPHAFRGGRQKVAYAAGFVAATAVAFSVLLLEPDPVDAASVFWDRTFGWQLSRPSPFSIWDWGEYPGYPDLALVQTVLKVALVVAALALYFLPRRKTALQLAALSGALIVGFELVLTHWFYLYIPWFFPFAAAAFLTPAVRRVPEPEVTPEREVRELVPAG
jgi:hypothetical protein